MKAYIVAIQRVFDEWGFTPSLISGPKLNDKEYGLKYVYDSLFAGQQSQNNVGKQHNVFGRSDLINLINSEFFRKCTSN